MKKLVLALAILFLRPAIAFANGNDEHMGDWGYMLGGGMFMWIIFLIVIVVVVLLIVRGIKSTSSNSSSRESPHDILKKRYAKGEITKEEFEKKKKDLET